VQLEHIQILARSRAHHVSLVIILTAKPQHYVPCVDHFIFRIKRVHAVAMHVPLAQDPILKEVDVLLLTYPVALAHTDRVMMNVTPVHLALLTRPQKRLIALLVSLDLLPQEDKHHVPNVQVERRQMIRLPRATITQYAPLDSFSVLQVESVSHVLLGFPNPSLVN
jgi:hypothetical protein